MPTSARSLGLLALVVGLLLGACTPAAPAPGASPAGAGSVAPAAGGAAPAPTAAAPDRPPAKVVLGKTGRGAELQFWPAYVAVAQGFFAREGIELEMTTLPSAYTLTQALIAGDTQVVGFTVLSMAAAVVAGAPVKLVAASQDLPSIRIVAAPSVGSWPDLKGKVVGSGNSAGDYFDVVLRRVLAMNGLADGDYTVRTMPGAARLPALESGQIAASILSDYDANLALQAGYKSFGFIQDYVKDIQYSGLLVGDQWAKANEAVLVGSLRALLRGAAWLFDPANRAEANRIFLAEGPELGPELVEGVYELAITQQVVSRTLRPSQRGIDNVLGMAYEQGALTTVPPAESWIDLSYLEQAAR